MNQTCVCEDTVGEFDEPIELPLKGLDPWTPFEYYPWDLTLEQLRKVSADTWESPLTRAEIQTAITECDLIRTPFPGGGWTREQHVQRVAYLVQHVDRTPILIDLGFEEDTEEWPIYDGHHRLAAAVFRGDTTIQVSFQGSVELIAHFVSDIRLAGRSKS